MTVQDAIESIDAYVTQRRPLGGFLTAVMENDLMEAMGRADDSSRKNLFEICSYIYNEISGNCHGSPKIVAAWLHGLEEEPK